MRSWLNIIPLTLMLLLSSCLDKKGYIDGEFALDGFTFDVIAPDFELMTPTPGYRNTTSISLRFNMGPGKINCESFVSFAITESSSVPSDSDFTKKCTVGGFQFESFSLDPTEGLKTIYVYAKSSQGQISPAKKISFILDTTNPTVNLTDVTGLKRGANSEGLSFTLLDTNDFSSITLEYFNGSSWSQIATPTSAESGFLYVYPTDDVPNAQFRLTGTDRAGNITVSTTSFFTVDSTPPSISFTTPPLLLRGGNIQNLFFTATDLNGLGPSSIEFNPSKGSSSFGSAIVNPSSPYAWTVPSIDTTDSAFRYTVSDAAGNVSVVDTTAVNIVIDSTPPVVSLDPIPALLQGGENQTLNFSATDSGSGIFSAILEYSQDGIIYSTIQPNPSSPYTWSIPTDDTTTARVRYTATDFAGNSTTVTSNVFTIDSTPPPPPPVTLVSASITNSTTTTITVNDCTDRPFVLLNMGAQPLKTDLAWVPCLTAVGNYIYTIPTTETTHTVRVWAKDAAGNVSATFSGLNVIYDVTLPTVGIADMNTILRGGASENITFNTSDLNGVASYTVSYAADGTNFSTLFTSPTVSPFSWTVPSEDNPASRLRITALDNAGNTNVATTAAFIVDSTPPAVTLDPIPALLKGGNNQDISFTQSDTNGISSTVLEYAADGSTYVTIVNNPTSPYTWSIPTDDTTTARIRYTVIDNAGNSTQVISNVFEVDSTPPPAPPATLASSIITNSTSTFVTVSDCTDRPSVLLNMGAQPLDNDVAWETCSTTIANYNYIIPAVETTHTIKVWAKDAAGNVSLTSTDLTVTYDVTPPTVSVTDMLAMLRGGASENIVFSTSDLNGIASYTVSYAADGTSFSPLFSSPTASPYTWTVPSEDNPASRIQISSLDNAGNSNVATTATFVVDSTPPSITLGAIPILLKGGNVQGISFTKSDLNGIASSVIEYAADGVTYSTLVTDPASSPWNWTVPSSDTFSSRIRFTVVDNVGNSSQLISNAFDIDSSPPVIAWPSFPASYLAYTTAAINWQITEPHSVNTENMTLEIWNGSAWSLLSTQAAATGSMTNAPYTYSYNFPYAQTSGYKFRLTLNDVLGHQVVSESPVFNVRSATLANDGNITFADTLNKSISAISTITITNNGDAPTIGCSAPSLADATHFTIVTDNCGTAPLAAAASCTIDVRFTPQTKGNGKTTSLNYNCTNSTTSLSLTGNSLNNAPTFASGTTVVVNEDTLISFNVNAATDIDGDPITYTLINDTTNGTRSNCLTIANDTDLSCIYQGNLHYFGSDSFTVRANDGTANSPSDATVSITVNSVNDIPVPGADQSFSAVDGIALNFTLNIGSDVETAAGSLTYKLISGPAVGTLTNCITTGGYTTDRTCTYTAPVNTSGTYSFTYLVNDGAADSVTTASVTITVSDQTPTTPNLTPANFASATSTSNSPITLTAASCTDIAFVMIQESSTAPTVGSPGWQACTTAIGGLTFDPSITDQQGFRTLRIYGRDPSDNISSSQLVNFIFDSQAPQMVFEAQPTLPNAIVWTINWTLTEATILAADNMTLEYTLNSGGTWSPIATIPVGTDGPHSSKPYSANWTVPGGTYNNTAQFRLTLTDGTGLTGVSTSNLFSIVADTTPPTLTAGGMKVNGSTTPPVTPYKYVDVSVLSTDALTNVTHFCLKTVNSPPLAADDCWVAVNAPNPGLTPALTLNLIDFPLLLGFVPGPYTVYAWTRDLKGNISVNTGTVGKDIVNITYDNDAPPEITNFFAANTSAPSNPLLETEMRFLNLDTVFIKWRATDDNALPAQINISYTTDDINYTSIVTGLSNGINNCAVLNDPGSTLDDNSTGCYEWSFPQADNQYFRLKIEVVDSANQGTSATSVPLNSSTFRVLAGNVSQGLNSSAKSALFAPRGATYLYSLAVASDGKIFFVDSNLDLLYINPQTGIVEQLLDQTGTYSGDSGPVRSATARYIYKITMDYQDRLIIWDYDRIRRVDTRTEPMQIETIIGGYNNGAIGTQTTDIVSNPADLKVYPGPGNADLLQPLPNGDIWFQAGPYGTTENAGNTLRIYRGSLPTPDIQTIHVSGTGAYGIYNGPNSGYVDVVMDLENNTIRGYYPVFDINTSAIQKLMVTLQHPHTGCSWYTMANVNTTTYVSEGPHPPTFNNTCGDYYTRVGLDGQVYRFNNNVAWPNMVKRYNTNDTYSLVIGTGNTGWNGYCPDGTPVTTCKTNVTDVFVTPAGQIFFIDNGVIRVVDDSGNVQTLYGQTKTYGDGGLAQDARFNNPHYIDHGVGDNVIIYDSGEIVMREVRPNELVAQIIKLAGNGESGGINFGGVLAKDQLMNGASWNQPGSFVTDPATGDVYFTCIWGGICKLNRATGYWEQYTGLGGGVHYSTNGTTDGATMINGGYAIGILFGKNGKLVTGHYEWSGSAPQYSTLREMNIATKQSTFMAGKYEVDGASGCPDGAGNGCNLNANRSTGRAGTYHDTNGTWLYEHNSNQIKSVSVSGTTGAISLFDTISDGVQSMVWVDAESALYYCNNSGRIKKRVYPSLTTTQLDFPTTTITCYGQKLLYKPASGPKPHRLVFPFSQNGMKGIAEYYLP